MLPPRENIVEKKICPFSKEEFIVTDKDLEFLDRLSPVFGGKKYALPAPTLSPRERMIRRDIWRNESSLHNRTCEATGEPVVSMYDENSGIKVYKNDYWWSDYWSAYDYGKKVDFNRSFYDQLYDLQKEVPVYATSTTFSTIENSPYINRATALKNCHLCFNANNSENMLYCRALTDCFACVDCFDIVGCQHSYELVGCQRCTSSQYLSYSRDCDSCLYGRDLSNCQYCFGCVNLTGKKYHFNNEALSKEEYFKKLATVQAKMSPEKIFAAFSRHQLKYPVRYMQGHKNESVSGDHIVECHNTVHSFMCQGCDDVRYCGGLKYLDIRNEFLMDVDHFGLGISHCYESSSVGIRSNRVLFSVSCWDGADNVIASINVPGAVNCFGCSALHKGKNAILNTSYSEHEWNQLAGKIVDHMRATGEWGEFFPGSMCPHGYNETVGYDYAFLTEKEVRDRNMRWFDFSSPSNTGDVITPLPIAHYDESQIGAETARENIQTCLQGVLICAESGRPFRISRQELVFYIENQIEIPKIDYKSRHQRRMQRINPYDLHARTCDQCGDSMQTTFAPERQEKVYCEECYRKEVY